MSASDPVADMLTKVRNAANARHEKVDIPASKLKLEIVKILKTEGYIKNFKKVQEEVNKHLKEGWELSGDLVIVSHHGSNYFVVAQPMVKKAEQE